MHDIDFRGNSVDEPLHSLYEYERACNRKFQLQVTWTPKIMYRSHAWRMTNNFIKIIITH